MGLSGLGWIMCGGALGTGLRYVISTRLNGASTHGLPTGTLTVNLLGCLAIGFLATFLSEASGVRPELRWALTVGFLGGFTTFSSFGMETLTLLQNGRMGTALSYVLISNVAGLALAWVGWRAASTLSG